MAYEWLNKLPLIFGPVFMLAHTSNIWLIVRKRKLHKPSYYLLLNLSIGDLMLLLTAFFNILLSNYRRVELVLVSDICYNVSILTTVHISIDRYIAISFCMKYKSIVTNKRLLYLIILTWIVSVTLILLPLFEKPNIGNGIRKKRLSSEIIRYGVVVLALIFLITLSMHTFTVRKKHVKQISGTQNRFGILSKERNILHKLKESINDVLKLNVITIVLVFASNAVYFYSDYIAHTHRYVIILIFSIYVFSNPVIYAVIMTDLRKQYVIILRNIRNFGLVKWSRRRSTRTSWLHEEN